MATGPEQIRSVGVVGLGYWGPKLARCFHQLGALKWVSDMDPGRVQEVCKWDPSIQGTTNYESMLDHVDALAIATPPETHYEIAKRALLVGKHVFVEKPLATTYKEARELEELAEKEERRLMVGHIYLHCPGIQVMVRPAGQADLHIRFLNPEAPPSPTGENILWAALPHALSLALHFFPCWPLELPKETYLGRRTPHRIQARLAYWNGSQAFIDVGNHTGVRARAVELRVGNTRFTYENSLPNIARIDSGTKSVQWTGEEGKKPLELEMEVFLGIRGIVESVSMMGSRVVKLMNWLEPRLAHVDEP